MDFRRIEILGHISDLVNVIERLIAFNRGVKLVFLSFLFVFLYVISQRRGALVIRLSTFVKFLAV
jgi:hypothetical protein